MGLPVLKRTQKTKSYSTGAETLEELGRRGYPIAELLLRYRELTKLKSTYVDALPAMVGAGRPHPHPLQPGGGGDRAALLGQPEPAEHPRSAPSWASASAAPSSRRPGQVLLVADYSQIELRILAHIADEKALIDAFAAGEDIHRATAAIVFDVAPELVTAEQRRAAKTINFGILYGMSAFGLSQELQISTKEADQFITAYLDRYPGVQRYVEETLEERRAGGQGRDPLRPGPLAAGHPEQELEPARERPPHGDQRPHPAIVILSSSTARPTGSSHKKKKKKRSYCRRLV